MSYTRRQFLEIFSATTVLLLTEGCGYAATKSTDDLIIGGGQYFDLNTRQAHRVLSIVDIQKAKYELIDLPFLPHGIAMHPTHRQHIALFEKKGAGACLVDIKTKKVIKTITTKAGQHFYGHGQYSPDGQILYCTENRLKDEYGLVVMRNANDMTFIGEFPTYGANPHECQWLADGKTLAITNGGSLRRNSPPSVTYVNAISQKLVETFPIPNNKINAGHLAKATKEGVIVVSAPFEGYAPKGSGGVTFFKKDHKKTFMSQDIKQSIQGEALSVVTLDNIAGVTHPDANLVTFWDINKPQLLAKLSFEKPRGIALTQDHRYFILSYGKSASIQLIDAKTFIPYKAPMNAMFTTGSHIYSLANTAKKLDTYGGLY